MNRPRPAQRATVEMAVIPSVHKLNMDSTSTFDVATALAPAGARPPRALWCAEPTRPERRHEFRTVFPIARLMAATPGIEDTRIVRICGRPPIVD